MLCPKCNYFMDALDKECVRCHGNGLGDSVSSVPASAMPSPAIPSAAAAAAPVLKTTLAGKMQAGGARLVLFSVILVFGYLFLFQTTVHTDPVEFMGTRIGGGDVYNIGLIAEKQNWITGGVGGMLLGGILFALGYAQADQCILPEAIWDTRKPFDRICDVVWLLGWSWWFLWAVSQPAVLQK